MRWRLVAGICSVLPDLACARPNPAPFPDVAVQVRTLANPRCHAHVRTDSDYRRDRQPDRDDDNHGDRDSNAGQIRLITGRPTIPVCFGHR